ncbi:MAG: hypothetical protein Unbinned200contig1000_36 [Prokaryotic dsDNA virus sp.]|jgi:hypothetical protein|nr:hypothetical protein [Flavobacteriaceae bacterium]QDP65296.1 MAG: hypothetical protein Unbinned200contig1000_36 [Prokaryotic dsDNA virus sp.]|tara:strand:+ start:43149 stop:43997 length:849 start_codon:yes stop_codon:yes gene_type:complete
MAKNEVANTENTQVSEAFDYGEYSHYGFEDTKLDDLSIPFLNVLQSNSPEVEDETIEGCKPGDLVNSVTKEILKQPVPVIPVYKEAAIVEWKPRTKGGGLVARHEVDSEIFLEAIKKNGGSRIPPKDADGKRIPFKSPEGNDLVETYYVYCLTMNEEGNSIEGYCVLSFSSTKIKVYKDWMTALYTQKGRPPIFANRCKISTVKQKNESGTFYNYSIAPFASTWRESLINPGTPEGQALLKEAKEFAEMIESGLARADFDSASQSDDNASSNSKESGEEIPF